MDYHGPTRDGPSVCLHNAPIDAICVDCARETCEAYPNLEATDALKVLEALDTLAMMGQKAQLDHGRIVAMPEYKAMYYLITQDDGSLLKTRSRVIVLQAIIKDPVRA